MGRPLYLSAAAAVIIAAAVVAAVVAATAHITAAAVTEQENQNDDPANITTAETVVVTHINYLRNFLEAARCRSFQDIPEAVFGAKKADALKSIGFAYVLNPTDRRGICLLRSEPAVRR